MASIEEESGQPQDVHDDRPFISDLLKENSSEIEAVRTIIQDDDLYSKGDNSIRYDDIWILRYVLSHKKNVESASKAAIATMHFREERRLNELGDIRYKVPSKRVPAATQFPSVALFNKFIKSDDSVLHTLPDKDRGVVSYCKICDIDQHKIAEEMTVEDLANVYIYYNESVFQVQDQITRRTGRLTKVLRVLDFDGLPLRSISATYIKTDTKASRSLQHYYPQLLGAVYNMNCPYFLSKTWEVFKPFFPTSIAEKMNFFGQEIGPTDLNYFVQYISEDNLPARYGGSNKMFPNIEDIAETFREESPM